MKSIDLVRQFHESFCQASPDAPVLPGLNNHVAAELAAIATELKRLARLAHGVASENAGSVSAMRAHLMIEELGEVVDAIAEGSLPHVLHELQDLQVVKDGTTLAFGLSNLEDAALQEIHRANMSKLGEDGRPVTDAAGRIRKGPNFIAANVGFLFNQR